MLVLVRSIFCTYRTSEPAFSALRGPVVLRQHPGIQSSMLRQDFLILLAELQQFQKRHQLCPQNAVTLLLVKNHRQIDTYGNQPFE